MISWLPADWREERLVGRIDFGDGPTPVMIVAGRLLDVLRTAATTADLLALETLAEIPGRDLGPFDDFHFQLRAQAGMTMVNLATAGVDYHVPFGGSKRSSFGARERGFAAVEFFTQTKTSYSAS